MKVSYHWLKNYLDFDLTPEEVSEILTDTGLEIEGLEKIEEVQGGLKGLIIGQVKSCSKHPDADRLKVAQVDIGKEKLQIVCGAPNVDKGQKVVVATVGSTLYPKPDEPFKIKKAKIRGVESFGMICAEDEIGLGSSHEGILVLNKNAKIGTQAADYFDLTSDYQLEIGLTPNRCDAMGHIGVARDLKAYLNFHNKTMKKLKLPSINTVKTDSRPEFDVDIQIEDPSLCSRYIGAVIDGIKVGPSPDWLKKSLHSIGLESINNIVDVTNYVMYEFGTPLHAFDFKTINKKILVKQAKKNQKFTSLDGIERNLHGEELMITNGSKNLCIAGVFGGQDSGISESSSTIFLESAIFDATSIRKTSKLHGLQTDASFRFERGVDPGYTQTAIERAISLILDITKGTLVMAPKTVESKKQKPCRIQLNTQTLQDRLGITISNKEIISILENLDFTCKTKKENTIELTVPSYRRDVYRPEDIMEEVLRIYGFNQVPIPKKWHISFNANEEINGEKIQRALADWFVSNGFNEVVNNSLSKAYLKELNQDQDAECVKILNPLSSELDSMRASLLFGLLENVKYNQNRQHNSLKLFELGHTYKQLNSTYQETSQLAFVLAGNKKPESWKYNNEQVDFYDIKGICTSLKEKLGLQLKEKEAEKSIYFESAQKLQYKKHSIFEYGEVSKEIQKIIGFKGKVYVGIMNLEQVLKLKDKARITFKELPKAFFVKRDFSLILDKEVSYESIERIAMECEKKLLKKVSLFDVYEGSKLPKNKKSYAVSFTFQHESETLKDAHIDKIMERIKTRLNKELGAELRA